MKSMTLGLLTLVLAASPATSAEKHREHGPHEHGHGTLNIAVENNRVSMDLDVPGMDIVGFEHAASTPEQKASIEKSEAELGRALALFKVPEAAGCKLTEAKVGTEEDDAHEGHEVDKGEAHEEHEGHSEFNAAYVLDCAKPAEIKSMTFDYFKSFAGADKLTVNIVSQKSQGTYEVTREKPVLNLGGMM